MADVEVVFINANRLNPYSNGRYSMREQETDENGNPKCLNPYYNGRYSMSGPKNKGMIHETTCLNPYSNGRYSMRGLGESGERDR